MPNLAEAETNAAFIRSSRRCVVVGDHTKWGMRGLAQVAPLDRADVVITDSGLPDAARSVFDSTDVDLCIVQPGVVAAIR